MDTYSADEFYATLAEELFVSRNRARATGGRKNIRARGDGPEEAVRRLIGSLVGGVYRVTQGHVVRADGMKSGQMDIIVVKDVPAATMYKADDGQTELVRVEWVAAVGEVKASWWDHREVLRSYCRVVEDMHTLQEGLLLPNTHRFGTMTNTTSLAHISRPITGREWTNRCYTFLIALAQAECRVKLLESEFAATGIPPSSASVLILDQTEAPTLCMPARMREKGLEMGVSAEVNLGSEDEAKSMCWTTIQEKGIQPILSCARLLHFFVTDLQHHLGTWYDEYNNARHYATLGPVLRRRHEGEV